MMDNDYFLDEEEFDDSSMLIGGDSDDEENEDESSEEEIGEEIKEEETQKSRAKRDAEIYGDKWTKEEIWLSSAYDDIVKASKKKENVLEDVVTTMIMADPQNTSAVTRNFLVKEALHKQGHARMVNTLYTPETALRGEDVDDEIMEDDNSDFNSAYAREAKERIAEFVEYLSTRDLSKDATVSRRRKLRQLPAFIIFLFSTGLYDLIINCPTMPPEYDKQIKNALEIIMKEKYSIVEELAKRYEEVGRDKVAERVRSKGLSWFSKEPNEIRTSAEYKDLEPTLEDVQIYRDYRSKFTNASKAITQDLISDLIEVVIDPEAAVYEKLKDKTRAEAISDVKNVFKKWNVETTGNSELASKINWGTIEPE